MKKQYIIPIFVPNINCLNNCIFCNEKEQIKNKEQLEAKNIEKIIQDHLKYVKENSKVEIAFLGGCFTCLDEKKQNELLNIAYKYINLKKVDEIRVSTTPDCIDKKILKRLKSYKVKTIELSVPSANDYILKKSGLKYNFDTVKKASRLIRLYGFSLGYQMMIGLPESTSLDEQNTAKQLIKLKPKTVRIYPVLVLKNSELEKQYKDGKYKELSLIQAIEICKDLVKLFAKKNIEVIRIGYNADGNENEIIAGPYHSVFRGLVESGIWYDVIVEKIKKLNAKVKEVVVTVNQIDFINVKGYNNENIDKLKKIYDVDLIVKQDNEIKQGKSKIEVTKTFLN